MGLSVFDHPFLSGLLGDPGIAGHFAVEAELAAMAQFEAELALAQAECGIIPHDVARAVAEHCEGFSFDIDALRAGTGRDGVVVPDFVRQLRAGLEDAHKPYLHFGATSQDVIDTALVLRLKPVLDVFDARIRGVIALLDGLEARFGQNSLMGRTRMQDALPITIADRIADWRAPLVRHLDRLAEIRPRVLVLQFGGSVGTLEKLGADGHRVAQALAKRLGLAAPEKAWHSQRDSIAELTAWVALVCGSLGKVGQDIALMAQNGIGDIGLSGGGGSSAMPHKVNPVGAETLVSLARFSGVLAGGNFQVLVHEQERSGAAWTLEWMIVPQIMLTGGAALKTAETLLGGVQSMGKG